VTAPSTPTPSIAIHHLPARDEVSDTESARRWTSLRRQLSAGDGVHLLVLAGDPDDSAHGGEPRPWTQLLTAVRGARGLVAVVATGPLSGIGLAVLAAADLSFATPRVRLSWGADPVTPGLAWLLTRRAGPSVVAELSMGRVIDAHRAMAGGLVTALIDGDPELSILAEELATAGPAVLMARARALRAAQHSGSWEASRRFDEHLAALEEDER
jgi:enoyl-CoA hydratase/carnithine racemase